MRVRARIALAIAALGLFCAAAAAQVELKSRSVVPSARTTAAFIDTLRAAPGAALHGLATLARRPDAGERGALAAAGITLLAPFQGLTYRVRVERKLDPRLLRD